MYVCLAPCLPVCPNGRVSGTRIQDARMFDKSNTGICIVRLAMIFDFFMIWNAAYLLVPLLEGLDSCLFSVLCFLLFLCDLWQVYLYVDSMPHYICLLPASPCLFPAQRPAISDTEVTQTLCHEVMQCRESRLSTHGWRGPHYTPLLAGGCCWPDV